MRKLLLCTIGIFIFLISDLKAQDPQFSQFFAAPLTLNPALSGAFSGRYRVGLVYRNQWQNQLESPMSTYAAAADFRFGLQSQGKKRSDGLGAGILFYADRFGNTGFSTNQIAVSAAYHKSLSDFNDQYLTLGAQIGIAQRNVNFENIFFQDQFNGTNGYTDPTAEPFPENNFTYPDLGVGLNYTWVPRSGAALFAGVAMHHITEPETSFFTTAENPEDNNSNKLHRKITTYLAGRIPISDAVQFHPRALMFVQGPHRMVNAGSNLRLLFNEIAGTAVHIGGWARVVKGTTAPFVMDSVVAMAGFEFSNILLGFSYDIGLSSLDTGNPMRRNVFEVSIAYLGDYDYSSVFCPNF
jgi:type IX secretion system PorP/SprF family membrane protein